MTSYINNNLQSTYKVTSFPVWYSSKISVGKKSLFIKTWYEKGVKVVNDFLDENGLFLSRELFKNKFNITNVCTMQYNSIISAIAKFLKNSCFSREEYCCVYGPGIPLYYEPLLFYKKCTKIIY